MDYNGTGTFPIIKLSRGAVLRAVSTVEDEESMSVVGELWREGEGCVCRASVLERSRTPHRHRRACGMPPCPPLSSWTRGNPLPTQMKESSGRQLVFHVGSLVTTYNNSLRVPSKPAKVGRENTHIVQ